MPAYTKKGHIVGVGGAAADLAPLLGLSAASLSAALTGKRPFVYVAKGVSVATWDKVSALGIPGLLSEATSSRSYPGAGTAASLIGWVRADGSGGGGLELLLNKELTGKPGQSTYEQGADGQIIPDGQQQVTPAVPGRSVRLTINNDLQWFAQNAIAAMSRQPTRLPELSWS